MAKDPLDAILEAVPAKAAMEADPLEGLLAGIPEARRPSGGVDLGTYERPAGLEKLGGLPPVPRTQVADVRPVSEGLISLDPLKLDPNRAKTPTGKFLVGLQRGGLQSVEGLTTPTNVGLLGGLTAARFIPVAGPLITAGAGVYFSYEMLKNGLEAVPAAKQAWDQGDYTTAGELVAQAAVSGVLGYGALKHTVKAPLQARMGLAPPPKPTLRIVPPGRTKEAVESARQAEKRIEEIIPPAPVKDALDQVIAEAPPAKVRMEDFYPSEVPPGQPPAGGPKPVKLTIAEIHQKATEIMDRVAAGETVGAEDRQILLESMARQYYKAAFDVLSEERKTNVAGTVDALLRKPAPPSPAAAPMSPISSFREAWNQTQSLVDQWRRERPDATLERQYFGKTPDTDRGYARYLDKYGSELPENLKEFWRNRNTKDQETGETLNVAEHGFRGGHIHDVGEAAYQEALPAEPTGPPSAPTPERPIQYIPTNEIQRDPARFQFKSDVGAGGVGEELKGVKVWDPIKAGTVGVWRDPADGKIYVVEGHHRHELAERLGVPEMAAIFINAKDAVEARGMGALLNISAGRGSAMDAARVMRDLGLTQADLERHGVTLKGRLAKQALGLSNLAQDVFDRVWRGEMEPEMAAVIGELLPGRFQDQRAVAKVLEAAEKRGRHPKEGQLREMIRRQTGEGQPVIREVQETLFGTEEIERGTFLEEAEVSEYVRKQLAGDKRLFGLVGEQGRAARLAEEGNVIEAERNRQIAQRAARAMEIYDKLSATSGGISDILREAGREIAEGGKPADVKQRAYERIREQIERELQQFGGGQGAGAQPVGPVAESEPGAAGPEQPGVHGAGELFNPEPGEGSILGSGLGALQGAYERNVAPHLLRAGLRLKEIGTLVAHQFMPRKGVPERGLIEVSKMKGEREKQLFVLEQTMSGIKRMFSEMPRSETIAFMDRMKRGQPQPTAELQEIADLYRRMDDLMYNRLTQYRESLPYKENHFRVFWKRLPLPEDVLPGTKEATERRGLFQRLKSKRPLRGTMGWARHATLEDVSEGIARGGEPVSYNPQVLFELSINDALRFVTAQRMWQAIGDLKMRKFVRRGQQPPEGYAPLDDNIAKVYYPPKGDARGFVESGQWYVEENLARILNNFLSRDLLRERGSLLGNIGRGMLFIKNNTTAIELSLSPFHAMFETWEAVASQIALATTRIVNQGLIQGNPAQLMRGLRDLVHAPVSPGEVSRLGGSLIRYVRNKDEFLATARGAKFVRDFPEIDRLIDDLFIGGGKLAMHEDYRINTLNAFKESLANVREGRGTPGDYVGLVARSVPALNQLLMHPLFEVYIPRLKIGFFLREYSQQLEQYGADIAAGRVARETLARQVWDRVENRFGEMNFDNLFWNRTFKTSLQLLFRSITWKLGNVRGYGNAIANQIRQVTGKEVFGEKRLGDRAYLDPGLAWGTVGLWLTSAVVANIIQLYHTGEPAIAPNDVIHPRVGGEDFRGKPLRVNIATWLKDVGHIAKDFPKSLIDYWVNSMSGWLSTLPEALRNRDYYGNYLTDPQAAAYERWIDGFFHVVGSPFSFQNILRAQRTGGDLKQVLYGIAGFPKAASIIDMTPAEKELTERVQNRLPARTPEEVARGTEAGRLMKMLKQGDPRAEEEIRKAVEAGKIKPAQEESLRRRSEEDWLEANFKRLDIESAMAVYGKANEQEKARLRPLLEDKEHLIDNVPADRRDRIQKQFERLLGRSRPLARRDEGGGASGGGGYRGLRPVPQVQGVQA